MNAIIAVPARTKGKGKPARLKAKSRGQAKKSREKVVELFRSAGKGRSPASRALKQRNEEYVVQFRLKARKLARSILRKWHAHLDLQEVDSLVDLSLCEAVRRYNPRKGASFMTFLYYHLKGNLIRAVSYAATVNAVPFAADEVAKDAEGSNPRRYQRAANAIEVAEALCSSDGPLPDEALLKKELVAMSHEACSRLDNLEREVIERIFLEGQQLLDIARQLGYSRCHISRVKKKALETLYDSMVGQMNSEERPSHRPDFSAGEGDLRRQALRRVIKRRSRKKAAQRFAKAA